jgi:hypothetical protein
MSVLKGAVEGVGSAIIGPFTGIYHGIEGAATASMAVNGAVTGVLAAGANCAGEGVDHMLLSPASTPEARTKPKEIGG